MIFLHKSPRFAGLAAAALVLALAGSSPALAKPDPGGLHIDTHQSPDTRSCLLERIGTQLIRCDTLTGAGTSAPTWIPER
ncbi:hypothetical protein CQ018_11075 [Arthrobacter sp. MYb227]|uniref:hypothetical protein n=1 Tax=Arthrobacter sp. MYb227 TaxID=1848601 RepID=UPI000CFDD191|nr:hypothetical protein [Arthrobacter sp. MYb227]PQZ92991.1 hypothetical protein CQ018_11075 [Arthrobacter sp. MYb227]